MLKNIIIVSSLLLAAQTYGIENNTESNDPITILEQRLDMLDKREQECRQKNSEKTFNGENIAVGGFTIGLTMLVTSFFISDQEKREPLMGTGFLTMIGSPTCGVIFTVYEWQELEAIKMEKMNLHKELGHCIRARLANKRRSMQQPI